MRRFLWLTILVSGCGHNLEGPCPDVDRVHPAGAEDAPAILMNTQGGHLTVDGDAFEVLPDGGLKNPDVLIPEVELWLDNERVEADVRYIDDRELEIDVPVTSPVMAPGLWDLLVTNPSGCDANLKDAVEIIEPLLDPTIVIEQIIPPFGWTDGRTAVTIVGSGFVSSPRAYLSTGGYVHDWEIEQVAFIDSTSLTGIVPSGLPVGGPYDLIVENPDQGFNVLEAAFTVTEQPPPDILTVVPEAGETSDPTPVVIMGENFDAAVRVVLIDSAGDQVDATVDASSDTEIQATIPSNTMSVGAWLVRAINEDDTWDTYSAFVVRNPSAKLGTEGSWELSEQLNLPRVGLGMASTTDQLGRGFLYVVGGSDGSAPHDTVERAQADAFGTLGGWELLSTRMNVPRAHGAVVEIDGWVYAIGGDDGSGPVDTVERARILVDSADVRPEILEATVEAGAGTMAEGTWYYRVSALMNAGDADNPGGETSASGSYVVRVEDPDGAVNLTWSAVAGADSYRVYRTDLPDGAAGDEHRIGDGVTETTFLDDGLAPGTEPFVPEGALGEWQLLPDLLPSPWAHGAMADGEDPTGVRFIYLVAGTDGGSSLADVYAMGPSGVWFVAGTLATPRVDNMAAAVGYDQAQALGQGSPTYIVAMEGDDGYGATNDAVSAEIEGGGVLNTWVPLNRVNGGGQARIDGVGLGAAGHLYILGGSGSANGAETSGRQAAVGPAMDMGSWSSTSASGTFLVPRADYGLVQLRALLYAAGGRTDADAATTSVEQVVF